MSFGHCFNSLIWGCLLLVVLPLHAALVTEKRCGDYIYQVDLHLYDPHAREYTIYSKKDNEKPRLVHKSDAMVAFDAACVQDKKGRYLFYFGYGTGGNCATCEYYGLYDPEKDKMLVRPGFEELRKEHIIKFHDIMGYDPPDMTKDDDRMFCCSKEQRVMMKGFKEDIFRAQQQCGTYIFKVQTSDLQDVYRKDYHVYYKKPGKKWRLFLHTLESIDFKAACLQDSKNRFVFYWEEYFGRDYDGSGPYGLFDIEKDKIVLEPIFLPGEQRNMIVSMLKSEPLTKWFCCNRKQEDAAIEKDPSAVENPD